MEERENFYLFISRSILDKGSLPSSFLSILHHFGRFRSRSRSIFMEEREKTSISLVLDVFFSAALFFF
jgi:hypothetical protein